MHIVVCTFIATLGRGGAFANWSVTPGLSLDSLAEKYLGRSDPGGRSGFVCLICEKVCQDKTAGKYHLEAKHFPSDDGYFCDVCGKHLKSQNALKCHLYQTHTKEERDAAKMSQNSTWGNIA